MASASTFMLEKQVSSIFGDNGKATVKISDAMLLPSATTVQAGAFALKGGALGDFVAWCLDIGSTLKIPSLYKTTDKPFSNSDGLNPTQRSTVRRLFNTAYQGLILTNNIDKSAFQIALWRGLYQGPDFKFTVTLGNADGTAAIAKADTLLSAARRVEQIAPGTSVCESGLPVATIAASSLHWRQIRTVTRAMAVFFGS